MAVTRRKINGKLVWVIDRRFRGPHGVERYRRQAQAPGRPAAEAEERRIIAYWTEHGTILPLLHGTTAKVQGESSEAKVPTWDDAVAYYRKHVLPAYEPSTRKGYLALLEGPHLRHWKGIPLAEITRARITEWDTKLVLTGMSASTRRNHHVILRSVLRSVGPVDEESGVLLDALPTFPPLPKVGRTEVEAVEPEDIRVLLGSRPKGFHFKSWERFQLAVALSAYAGLRASEIRALRRRDIDLKSETITVRLKRCAGEEGPPKSKHQRTIDFIAPELLRLLMPRCDGLRPEDYVCPNGKDKPWGDSGLWQMFRRTCSALGVEGRRYHGLRHAFATSLFGGNVDARTVQELLGHSSLDVTMRYAHTSKRRKRAAGRVFGCPDEFVPVSPLPQARARSA